MSIQKMFLKYVSLNIIGMIGLSCYILADTFFVARGVGSDGLAALNLAIPIYNFLNGTGLMIGMGGATRFSISRSEKVFMQSIYCVIISSIVFLTLSLFSRQISYIMGADEHTIEHTTVYLRTFLSFSPMFLLNNCLINFVRNDGNPTLPMIAMLIGSLFNIVFDYIFIFPFNMGMFGAALATGFSPIVSVIILSSHFWRHKNEVKLRIKKPSLKSFLDIASLGVPSLITEFSSGIVMISFNMCMLYLAGNTGVAAYGVVANIALVIVAVFTGISQGIQPLVSMNYGKGNIKDSKSVLYLGLITAVGIAVAVYLVTNMFAKPIVLAFNKENDLSLAMLAQSGLKLYFTAFIFMGVNILCSTFFSSVEMPKKAFLISILRGFVLILPIVFIFAALFGINGVWLSITASEFLVFLYAIYSVRSINKV